MFAPRSPRSPRSPRNPTASVSKLESPPEISTLLASELGMEYASLRAANNCPLGMYITPSPDTLLKWHGVFFVHRGPYAGSVLRFTLLFPIDFPNKPPTIRFDSDVFHPMVDPKTKIWYPRGRMASWRPRIDHIPHLLHHLKSSFKTQSLASIKEDEARNKQVWSLYHHSPNTFLSLTLQRARNSISRQVLYPDSVGVIGTPNGPASPTSRTFSLSSSEGDGEVGPINFREISEAERDRLWTDLQKSLGV